MQENEQVQHQQCRQVTMEGECRKNVRWEQECTQRGGGGRGIGVSGNGGNGNVCSAGQCGETCPPARNKRQRAIQNQSSAANFRARELNGKTAHVRAADDARVRPGTRPSRAQNRAARRCSAAKRALQQSLKRSSALSHATFAITGALCGATRRNARPERRFIERRSVRAIYAIHYCLRRVAVQ